MHVCPRVQVRWSFFVSFCLYICVASFLHLQVSVYDAYRLDKYFRLPFVKHFFSKLNYRRQFFGISALPVSCTFSTVTNSQSRLRMSAFVMVREYGNRCRRRPHELSVLVAHSIKFSKRLYILQGVICIFVAILYYQAASHAPTV